MGLGCTPFDGSEPQRGEVKTNIAQSSLRGRSQGCSAGAAQGAEPLLLMPKIGKSLLNVIVFSQHFVPESPLLVWYTTPLDVPPNVSLDPALYFRFL